MLIEINVLNSVLLNFLSNSKNELIWMKKGESTSKAKNLVSIVNSIVNEQVKIYQLWEVKYLLKFNVYSVKASAITYLLHNGLAS